MRANFTFIKRIPRLSQLVASCLLTILVPALTAALPISYDASQADADPVSQGWTGQEVFPGVDGNLDGFVDDGGNVGAVDDGGEPAWQLFDRFSEGSRNLPGYFAPLTAAEQDAVIDSGWEFSATVRLLANNTAGNTAFFGWGLSAAATSAGGADRRCGFFVRIGADNAFEITDTDGNTIKLDPGSADHYHTVSARGVPGTTRYDWFINGSFYQQNELLDQSIGGITAGQVAFNSLNSSAAGGVANFKRLQFKVPQFALKKWVVANGGGGPHASSDGRFTLDGTVGQAEASPKALSGDSAFATSGGYWKSAVVQVAGAPELFIQAVVDGFELSWQDPVGEWELESSPDLRAASWTIVPDGTLSPITVDPLLGRQFYRLRRR